MGSKTSLPNELADYRLADEAAANYRAKWRIVGWIGTVLVALGLSGIFLVSGFWGERGGLVVLLLGTACLAWFVYNRFVKKHAIPCRQCGQMMDVVDVPFTKNQLNPLIDRPTQSLDEWFAHSFEAVDGTIYRTEPCGNRRVGFYRLLQRWYACHGCKHCFLAEERIKELVETVDSANAVRKKKSLVTDDSEVRDSLKRLSDSEGDD